MIVKFADKADADRLQDTMGIRFDRRDLNEIVDSALKTVNSQKLYVTCNLNHLRVLQSDGDFRQAYGKASVITMDSRPMQMVSRIRYGEQLPLVTGADLFAVLMERLVPGRDRPFFVASSTNTGERLVRKLVDRGFAAGDIGVISPPFGFEKDGVYSQSLLSTIREHRPTHLFMGWGRPSPNAGWRAICPSCRPRISSALVPRWTSRRGSRAGLRPGWGRSAWNGCTACSPNRDGCCRAMLATPIFWPVCWAARSWRPFRR